MGIIPSYNFGTISQIKNPGLKVKTSELVMAKQRSKNKVLVIGLDAATWGLPKPWADRGRLPNLKNLMHFFLQRRERLKRTLMI